MFTGIFLRILGIFVAFALPGMAPSQTTQEQEIDPSSAFIWHTGQETKPQDAKKDWFTSNFSIANPRFRTGWSRSAVQIDGDALVLFLRPSSEGSEKDFVGGELQRRRPTHFGRYEVEMTAARGEGVISSFFTYTGPHFDDPHDEIDFEFLGRDTTKVWLNRFVGGSKLPGQWIDLGFDAADEPHLYAFEWLPDEIIWYVDGRELLRVDDGEKAIPEHPGKVYINIWAGGERQRQWSGVAPDTQSTSARYYCMSYQPLGSDTEQCSDRGAS